MRLFRLVLVGALSLGVALGFSGAAVARGHGGGLRAPHAHKAHAGHFHSAHAHRRRR